MRNAQSENFDQPVISALQANPSFSWKQIAQLTLLAMAASLLLLGSRCRALTASVDTARSSSAVQAPQSAADAREPMTSETARPRVVRLSDVEGTVQLVRNSQTEFSHAVMNMPLTQGSRIETGPDGRAEVEFEDGSVTRITPNSSLNLAKLDTTAEGTLETTLEQSSGLVYYELRSDSRSAYTVIFGQSKAAPTANSTFRINLGSSPAELAVIDGHVEVNGTSNDYMVEVPQGKTIEFQPSNGAQYTMADGIIPNGFDDWNDQLDQEAAKQAANQTTARVQQRGGSIMDGGLGFGWGDLDAYGGWYPLPGYGMVWQPYGAGPGFDPYGFGDWADIGGFGVSWVSGYPWGWLPFQCGGWSYIGSFGWGWTPGGCGFGIGFDYGGYYGGRYWHRHSGEWGRGYTRIYSAPAGYHAPVPPAGLRTGLRGSQPGQNLIHVGSAGIAVGSAANRARTIDFNGTKIAPLHPVMTRANVPVRNAALFNNSPARAFQGGMHGTFTGHNGSFAGHGINGQPGTSNAMRTEAFNRMRASNTSSFGNRSTFGQRPTFGSHGSFRGSNSSFHSNAGGGFHSGGGGFRGGGGGFSAGGGGGFHGGGGGGGGHSSH